MKKNKKILRKKIYHFLLYLTNNLPVSKHEEAWDIVFFLVAILSTIGGIVLFLIRKEPQWIPVILLEFCWLWDNIKFNRK